MQLFPLPSPGLIVLFVDHELPRLSQVKIVCPAVRSKNGFREGILKEGAGAFDLKEDA